MEGYGQFCPVAMTAELLTRRWTPLVIRELEYHLTRAGEELGPIILQMGAWGRRWAQSEVSRRHLDAGLLMWDIHRRVRVDRLPGRRVVVRFQFAGARKGQRDFWLVLHGGEVDLCLVDPGHDVDLWVEADLLTMTRVWLGDVRFLEAARCGAIQLTGPSRLRQGFPGWLGLDASARTKRVAAR